MNKINIKCIMCAVVAVVIAFSVTGSGSVTLKASANTLSDLQNKYAALEKQQQALKNELSDTQNSINNQQAKQNALEKKISIIQSQVWNLNLQISRVNEDIKLKQNKIIQKQAEIKVTYEKFKERMRAAYMSSDPSMIGIILGAEDISDFIMRTEMVQRISDHDKQIVDQLKAAQKELKAAKEGLEQDKGSLQKAKDILTAKQSDLDAAYAQSETAMESLEESKKDYMANKAEIDRQMEQADREIQAIIIASQKDNDSGSSKYTGGRFVWPVPGYTNISCYYGWRTWDDGSREFHKGMDISQGGIYGASVVAAASGTVLIAQNYNSNGYGNYVVIDHGGGLSTLYGHNSKVVVSAGQTVKKGQVISKVGSTGWSTGPHLHFEVRKNGVHTNPLPYLKK